MTGKTELKRLAEAATPGPWYAENERHEGAINAEYRHIGMVSMFAQVREDIPQNFANQAFIAAANPAAVLALLAERAQLKAEVDSLTREADRQYTTIEAYRKNADRYVWLRDNHIGDNPESINLDPGSSPGLNSAVDAAMGKGEQP